MGVAAYVLCADLQGPLTATLGYMFVLASRGDVLDHLSDNTIRTLVSIQGTCRGMTHAHSHSCGDDAVRAETQQNV